jgi:hypothetical protein
MSFRCAFHTSEVRNAHRNGEDARKGEDARNGEDARKGEDGR